MHVLHERRHKLQNTSTQIIFVGYDKNSKAYRCYDPVNKKLVISWNVRFVAKKIHSEEVVSDSKEKQTRKYLSQMN